MPPSRSRKVVKLKPPLPPPQPGASLLAQQPLKVLQGQGTRRSDSTHPGHARTSLFITRRTKLGALIARARSLVLDEGATELRLYALGAAISHAFVLLHALMDILPYPVAGDGRAGMWFEIKTGTTECRDMVQGKLSGLGGQEEVQTEKEVTTKKGEREGEGEEAGEVEPGEEDWGDLGLFIEEEPEIQTRNKASVEIVLHISGRKPTIDTKPKKKARPSAKKRRAARGGGVEGEGMDVDPEDDEEALMNM